MEPITWLGTTTAAEHLGLTLRTLYRLIASGEIPAYQVGRVIRLKEADLERFVERAQITPGSLAHLYRPLASQG